MVQQKYNRLTSLSVHSALRATGSGCGRACVRACGHRCSQVDEVLHGLPGRGSPCLCRPGPSIHPSIHPSIVGDHCTPSFLLSDHPLDWSTDRSIPWPSLYSLAPRWRWSHSIENRTTEFAAFEYWNFILATCRRQYNSCMMTVVPRT